MTTPAAAATAGRRFRPTPILGGVAPDVSLVSQYELDSGSAADSVGGVNGTVGGTWDAFDITSLVTGVAGTAFFKSGGDANITLPANQPAHALGALSLSFYYQPSASANKHTLFAATDLSSTGIGDLSIERLTNGRLRAFHVGADGGLRFFESTDGIAATNLMVDVAYRITLTLGPSGAKLYLDDTEVAAIPENTNSWNNTRQKFFGTWVDSAQGFAQGAFDHIRLWDGELQLNGVQALEPAQEGAPPGGTGDIVLAPIIMWGKIVDDAFVGEKLITDTATGGTIQSATGGTLPAFPLTVDPTPFVSNASGGKATWTVQFRNSTLGTWAQLGGGDLQFTPGTTAGLDQSEYRVSDDSGVTFSDWAAVETRVLDRSLAPGPYFLVEDFGGSDENKLNSARDAANSAGGGTVTTLNRSTVLQDIVNHVCEANVHYLFISAKKPRSQHSPSGDFCSTSDPNGEGSGWQPDENDDVFTYQNNRISIVNTGVRHNIVGGFIDGNSFQQTLHQTSGASPDPTSTDGSCWPGVKTTNDLFNLQFNSIVKGEGDDTNTEAGRQKLGFYGTHWINSVADGFRGVGSVDIIAEDMIMEGMFRGSWVIDGGNSKRVSTRVISLEGDGRIGGGIDDEMLTHPPGSGNQSGDFTDVDMFLSEDLDQVLRDDGVYVHQGGNYGPGFNIFARTTFTGTNRPRLRFEGSTANPRTRIRFHGRNGGAGGDHRTGGWAGGSPHDLLIEFVDVDFITWGASYVKHARLMTPTGSHNWGIELWSVTSGANFDIHLTNCQCLIGPNMPGGSPSLKLFRTIANLTTTQIVRIDGLTIAAGYDLATVVLDGQRLEHRNVSHLGSPGATIQQICPGAGQYVAI